MIASSRSGRSRPHVYRMASDRFTILLTSLSDARPFAFAISEGFMLSFVLVLSFLLVLVLDGALFDGAMLMRPVVLSRNCSISRLFNLSLIQSRAL